MRLASPLYAILDTGVATRFGWTVPRLAQAYLEGGARLLQIRAKDLTSAAYLALCEEVSRQARAHAAQVIINDRADIAVLVEASGVHVGQDDLPAHAARRLVGDARIVGLSTHTMAQVEAAVQEPVSYIAVGPVFPTGSKDTGYAPVGPELVREAVARAGDRPVVGIGGITLERAVSIIEAGAAAVAVISDLLTEGDPGARVRAFLAALEP